MVEQMKRDGRGKLKGKRNRREGAERRQWEAEDFKDNVRMMYAGWKLEAPEPDQPPSSPAI